MEDFNAFSPVGEANITKTAIIFLYACSLTQDIYAAYFPKIFYIY